MSQPFKHVSTPILVTLASCIWFPRLNVRKHTDPKTGEVTDKPEIFNPDDPLTRDLIASLRDRGFDPQYPVIVGNITPEYIKEAAEFRAVEYERFKHACKTSPSDEAQAVLTAWEFYYLVTKGKSKEKTIAVPDHLGCTGNRRSAAMFAAAVQRLLKAKADPQWAKETFKLAVVDPFNDPAPILDGLGQMNALSEVFATDDDRRMRQIAENTAKTEGFKNLNVMEILMGVKEGVETGRILQARLRETFKDGMGQKIYGFLVLNSKFPNLDLLNRIRFPESNPRAIPWSRLPQGGKEGFPEVLRRTNRMQLDEWNRRKESEGKTDEVATFMEEADVEAMIQKWKTGKVNEKKMMEKTAIVSLQGASPVKIVNDLLEDVLKNEKKHIDKVTICAPLLNGAYALAGTPVVNTMTTVIQNVVNLTDEDLRNQYVAALANVKVPASKVPASKETVPASK